MPDSATASFWRVFPFDPEAPSGQQYSATYVPPSRGANRFDLSSDQVLYLAEDPVHAIAENIADYRGLTLKDYHLIIEGRRLAVISVGLSEADKQSIVDLCDPSSLVQLEIRPDQLAARDRATSQAAAAKIYTQGSDGLRWWSAYFGEWHSIVLFLDRVPISKLQFGQPRHLFTDDPLVRSACEALGIGIE